MGYKANRKVYWNEPGTLGDLVKAVFAQPGNPIFLLSSFRVAIGFGWLLAVDANFLFPGINRTDAENHLCQSVFCFIVDRHDKPLSLLSVLVGYVFPGFHIKHLNYFNHISR